MIALSKKINKALYPKLAMQNAKTTFIYEANYPSHFHLHQENRTRCTFNNDLGLEKLFLASSLFNVEESSKIEDS